MKSIQKDRLKLWMGIFVRILVGKLRASVTFNGNGLHEALDKEQTHVDGKGPGLQ